MILLLYFFFLETFFESEDFTITVSRQVLFGSYTTNWDYYGAFFYQRTWGCVIWFFFSTTIADQLIFEPVFICTNLIKLVFSIFIVFFIVFPITEFVSFGCTISALLPSVVILHYILPLWPELDRCKGQGQI